MSSTIDLFDWWLHRRICTRMFPPDDKLLVDWPPAYWWWRMEPIEDEV